MDPSQEQHAPRRKRQKASDDTTTTTSTLEGSNGTTGVGHEWKQMFDLLCAFQLENGHCRVPTGYVIDSVKLGYWVSHQRQFYKNSMDGKKGKCASITEERIAQLNSIGFVWRIETKSIRDDAWQQMLELLHVFQRKNGHCRVSRSYAIDSVNLGGWVKKQRQYYKNYKNGKNSTGASITEERIAQLNAIGFEWSLQETPDSTAWQHKFALLCAFRDKNGHCRVPFNFVVDSDLLGVWVSRQRHYFKKYKDGKTGKDAWITEERIAQLDAIGFEWILTEKMDAWQHKFECLRTFQLENGHCLVPTGYEVDSVKLGYWVFHQRQFYKNYMRGKKGKCASITDERISQLNSIGFEWRFYEDGESQRTDEHKKFDDEKADEMQAHNA